MFFSVMTAINDHWGVCLARRQRFWRRRCATGHTGFNVTHFLPLRERWCRVVSGTGTLTDVYVDLVSEFMSLNQNGTWEIRVDNESGSHFNTEYNLSLKSSNKDNNLFHTEILYIHGHKCRCIDYLSQYMSHYLCKGQMNTHRYLKY